MALASLVSLSCRGGVDAGSATAHARVATVRGLGGRVDVLRGGSADWGTLGDGAALFEADRLRTYRGAWAQLIMAGGSSLRVEEETLISLGGEIMVEHGTIAGELQPGLTVRTPTLEATANRDIEFR
jgi:hypothetical protein